ncbi:metalloregulator ArsR/SmtB family transcription factor [Sphingobium sp.]|uniref:ArsR/SmtB family transcription factor n=1 Tax=Sphingobium sp. TaxID=1912891 RepID=UPI002621366D|nr:metalloregulator ArsR/SmtB family transcription factor [Sphingobium sp.]
MNDINQFDQLERLDPLAEVARALGHPHRLALLEHIVRAERSVERLADLTDMSVANASQHLQQLKRAGCVQARRDGKNILYSLGQGPLAAVVAALHDYVAFKQDRIDQAIADSRQRPQEMESVSIDALVDRMNEGAVILVDVRPGDEFRKSHLPGAVNIPIPQLEERAKELSDNAHVVAYCKGPYCVLTREAVVILRAQGVEAAPLAGGVPEWRAAGYRLDEGV